VRLRVVFLLPALVAVGGCSRMGVGPRPGGRTVRIVATAYCPCKECCGWKRNWLGQPVFASGPLKGKRKTVGQCADGTMAEHGTIAADTDYYPFGTKMHVPGYGYGVVHDRGGDIKGANRIDLFYKSHRKALEWGRQEVQVTVYGSER